MIFKKQWQLQLNMPFFKKFHYSQRKQLCSTNKKEERDRGKKALLKWVGPVYNCSRRKWGTELRSGRVRKGSEPCFKAPSAKQVDFFFFLIRPVFFIWGGMWGMLTTWSLGEGTKAPKAASCLHPDTKDQPHLFLLRVLVVCLIK